MITRPRCEEESLVVSQLGMLVTELKSSEEQLEL